MTRIALATMLLLGLPLAVTGCDSTIIGDVPFIAYDLAGITPDGGTTFIPGKPLVGQLIDRVGRPAINLALTDGFGTVSQMTQGAVQNQYNSATPGNWFSFAPAPYIAANLAIFDGLDGNCGNQTLANMTLSMNRYLTLAQILADDRLYINANTGICMTYLAVETGTVGDCGGWHPTVNAMDTTYNLLIAGSRTAMYSNGSTADLDGGIAFNAPFPFLLGPK